MIYIVNEDAPGFIGRLGTSLGEAGVNIATFHLGRREAGGEAVALVSVDGHIAPGAGRAARGDARGQEGEAAPLLTGTRAALPHCARGRAFMRPLLLLAALLLAAPAAAQRVPEWRTAPEADILLRPFAYEPNVIRLRAGQPVKLRFVNNGRTTLGFSAPGFFAAAGHPPHDRA